MGNTPSELHGDTPSREVAMPWLETDPMNERLKFRQDALSDRFAMAELPMTTREAHPGVIPAVAPRRIAP